MSNLKTPFRYDFCRKFLRPETHGAQKSFDNADIGYDELKKVEDETIIELVSKLKEPGISRDHRR